jgi:hypothetical protein
MAESAGNGISKPQFFTFFRTLLFVALLTKSICITAVTVPSACFPVVYLHLAENYGAEISPPPQKKICSASIVVFLAMFDPPIPIIYYTFKNNVFYFFL